MLVIYPQLVSAAGRLEIDRLSLLARHYLLGKQARSARVDVGACLESLGVEQLTAPVFDQYLAVTALRDVAGTPTAAYHVGETTDPLDPEHRFLRAHCLGHMLMHLLPQVFNAGTSRHGFFEIEAPARRYIETIIGRHVATNEAQTTDSEADMFAAAFLMPKAMVLAAHRKQISLEKISDIFGVSREIAHARLAEVGVRLPSGMSFLAAESLVRPGRQDQIGTDEKVARETLTGEALEAAIADRFQARKSGMMPKAFAASTYQTTESKTENKSETPHRAEPSPSKKLSGMERIRAIAQQMEKNLKP